MRYFRIWLARRTLPWIERQLHTEMKLLVKYPGVERVHRVKRYQAHAATVRKVAALPYRRHS